MKKLDTGEFLKGLFNPKLPDSNNFKEKKPIFFDLLNEENKKMPIPSNYPFQEKERSQPYRFDLSNEENKEMPIPSFQERSQQYINSQIPTTFIQLRTNKDQNPKFCRAESCDIEIDLTKIKPGVQIELGEGSFAKVYLAECDKYPVALKKFEFDKDNDRITDMVSKEKEMSEKFNKIKSKYFSKFYGSFSASERKNQKIIQKHTLVYEYGFCTFQDYIKKKTFLPESEILSHLRTFSKILMKLENHHIAHMDLKPANIVIFPSQDLENYCLKLVDYGVSLDINKNKMYRGCSEYYAAPEIILNGKIVGGLDFLKNDIYSVGIICLNLMGVKREEPYSSDIIWEEIEKKDCDYPFLIPILKEILQFHPEKRITPTDLNRLLKENRVIKKLFDEKIIEEILKENDEIRLKNDKITLENLISKHVFCRELSLNVQAKNHLEIALKELKDDNETDCEMLCLQLEPLRDSEDYLVDLLFEMDKYSKVNNFNVLNCFQIMGLEFVIEGFESKIQDEESMGITFECTENNFSEQFFKSAINLKKTRWQLYKQSNESMRIRFQSTFDSDVPDFFSDKFRNILEKIGGERDLSMKSVFETIEIEEQKKKKGLMSKEALENFGEILDNISCDLNPNFEANYSLYRPFKAVLSHYKKIKKLNDKDFESHIMSIFIYFVEKFDDVKVLMAYSDKTFLSEEISAYLTKYIEGFKPRDFLIHPTKVLLEDLKLEFALRFLS